MITRSAIKGMRHIIAKAEKPAVINSYMASKNRRKSRDTLPPFSLVYVLSAFAIYLACSFSVAVKPSCEIRYTKLLNFVYGGNWPTNSSTA